MMRLRCALVSVGLAIGAALTTGGARTIAAQAAPQGAASTLRTDTLFAWALGVKKSLVVYLPSSYERAPTRRYPVVLFLHGLGGNEQNWTVAGQLHRTMDSLVAAGAPEAILAMPDGDDGWYTTAASLPDLTRCPADTVRREPAATYCVPWPHYDDYIVSDILGHLDARYRTKAERAHRAIAGLSMGGYGAMTLALSFPEQFAAAASHSGVLSPRLLPGNADSAPRYAQTITEFERAAGSLWPSQRIAFGADSIAWWARDPRTMAQRLDERVREGKATWPALFVDVGTEDRWLLHNRDFRAALTALGVPHRYAEWPGGHSWTYWRPHAAESLRFLLDIVGR
jgi:S-formylglutathione hydrolase FrmB